MSKKAVILIFTFICWGSSLQAQIQVNGTFDAGFSSGGKSSAFISNGISNEYRYLHFSIPQINLLLFAPINDNWYFEARLQSDTWGEGTLRYPRFTLGNITYADPEKSYSLSAGRFISTFGFYPSRNLTIDRTFIELPLAYSYYISMSDIYGYWDQARYQNGYSYGDGLMTTVYYGGYSTGFRWDWELSENKANLQTSITTVAPGSSRDYTNLGNLAIQSRLILNPSIEWQIGFSGAYGSFMHYDPAENDAARQATPLENFRQTVFGIDLRYGFGFWEIIAETIYSRWKVPEYVNGAFEYEGTELEEYHYSNIGANIDIKFEPPFLPGSYIAFRADHLNFIEENPVSGNLYGTEDWDKDKFRFTGALGYKISRNVEAKVLVSEQTPFDYSLYAFKAVITAFF